MVQRSYHACLHVPGLSRQYMHWYSLQQCVALAVNYAGACSIRLSHLPMLHVLDVDQARCCLWKQGACIAPGRCAVCAVPPSVHSLKKKALTIQLKKPCTDETV